MKRLDLSSIGWEYVEIRGRRFQDLLAVQLRVIPSMVQQKKVVPLQASQLENMNFVSKRHCFERRITATGGTPHLTNRELTMLFPMFDRETMLIDGEANKFEPDGPGISFTTHHRIAVKSAMAAPDHLTKKPAGILSPKEFGELVSARTVPLSKIRMLHKLMDPDGRHGETAVIAVMGQINKCLMQEVDSADEVAIFSVDGNVMNPPIRIVFDDAMHKPSVFSDYEAYKNALKTETEAEQKAPTNSQAVDKMRSEVAGKMLQVGRQALEAHEAKLEAKTKLGTAAKPSFSTAASRVDVVAKEQSQAPALSTKSVSVLGRLKGSSEVPQELENGAAVKAEKINIDGEGKVAEPQTGRLERFEVQAKPIEENSTPVTPKVAETTFSVADVVQGIGAQNGERTAIDWIRNSVLLNMRYHDIRKKLKETYSEFAKENPFIDFDLFSRTARLFIREQSLRILSGQIDARSARVKNKELANQVDDSGIDELFQGEKFEFTEDESPSKVVQSRDEMDRTDRNIEGRTAGVQEERRAVESFGRAQNGIVESEHIKGVSRKPSFSQRTAVSQKPGCAQKPEFSRENAAASGGGAISPPVQVQDVSDRFEFTEAPDPFEKPGVEDNPSPPTKVRMGGGILGALRASKELPNEEEHKVAQGKNQNVAETQTENNKKEQAGVATRRNRPHFA